MGERCSEAAGQHAQQVDCIHFEEGVDRMLYVDPIECIDCGACQPACPVTAILPEAEVPPDQQHYVEINQLWFSDPDAARAKIADVPVRAEAAQTVTSDGAGSGAAAPSSPAGEPKTRSTAGGYKYGENGIEGKCALCGQYVIKGGTMFRKKSVLCPKCAQRSERVGNPYARTAGRR